MNLTVNQTTNTNFKAKLTIATKDKVVSEAGKFCAEQLERAKPSIEKIAKNTKDVDIIRIDPALREVINPKTNQASKKLMITLGKNGKLPQTFFVDEFFYQHGSKEKSFSEYIVDSLNTYLEWFRII